MKAKKSRVPLKFRIASFEARTIRTPLGVIDQPRHWELRDQEDRILGSGPYESEMAIQLIVRCAAAYINENPQKVKLLLARLLEDEDSAPAAFKHGIQTS